MALAYAGKRILAPMVRIGTLPSRLLALDYGADIVYSEEIIDHKLIECKRVVNTVLDTVDFNLPDGTNVFRTCAREKAHVVLQIGTADPARAVQVVRLVGGDIAGIDVNMGCPKEYSTKGGMGAALLETPELARSILTALVAESPVPVTAKIRILPTVEDSIRFAQMVASTGVAAVAVHYRLKAQRPREQGSMEHLRAVVAAVTRVPVIANGGSLDIRTPADVDAFWAATGASSVMVARAAQWNMSVFRREGLLPPEDVVRAFLCHAMATGNSLGNTKYCVLQTIAATSEDPRHRATMSADTMRDLCDVWGLADEFARVDGAVQARAAAQNCRLNEFGVLMPVSRREIYVDDDGNEGEGDPAADGRKRAADDDGQQAPKRRRVATELDVRVHRGNLSGPFTPKNALYELAKKRGEGVPQYDTHEVSRNLFRAFVTFEGREYTSAERHKSKKHAEQAAALACLTAIGEAPEGMAVSEDAPAIAAAR